MEAIDVMGTYGASDAVFETTFIPLSLVKYPTERIEALCLSRLDRVFGEPATISYNKCTGTIDWKLAMIMMKLAIRISHT